MEIALKDINKRYGRVQANDGITWSLKPGRIYGLLGENGAGKSTLMRILAGHTIPDSGEIEFDGRSAGRLTPARAMEIGVGMLYQDPLDFPAMKVWENFQLGSVKRSRKQASKRLDELAVRLGFSFEPEEKVCELTVGERQQLELLRLMDAGVKTLILDEPTTGISLTQKEKLFNTLRKLRTEKDRITIIVTHKISEAIDLCDEILIMRQGGLEGVMTPPFDTSDIIAKMFGSEDEKEAAEQARIQIDDRVKLELENIEFRGDKYSLPDVSLKARPGEIIGLAGLEGNGQSLLLMGLAGLTRMTSGKMNFFGESYHNKPFLMFKRSGIHFLPAARLEQGLFPELSLTEHVCLAFPDQKDRLSDFYNEECRERFRLLAEPSVCARTLSGGNQQRLLLSLIPAWTRLLLMEHPTRGLDMGSARQVWTNLEERCRNGAMLFFSSADLDEIMAYSSRVLVFYERRIIADLPTHELSLDLLGSLMAGKQEAA